MGSYIYIGKKNGINDQGVMSLFLMFKRDCSVLNNEIIEGYETTEHGLVERSITIRCPVIMSKMKRRIRVLDDKIKVE